MVNVTINRENAEYNSRPENIHKRVLRNAARAYMESQGKAHVGDGKDVGHIKALSKGGQNKPSNFEMQSKAENRSFSRNKKGGMVSEVSKKERRK